MLHLLPISTIFWNISSIYFGPYTEFFEFKPQDCRLGRVIRMLKTLKYIEEKKKQKH